MILVVVDYKNKIHYINWASVKEVMERGIGYTVIFLDGSTLDAAKYINVTNIPIERN